MHGASSLKASVLAALAWDPSIVADHVGVTVNEGVVSLTGHVGSFGEKHAAVVAAGRIKGVKAVVADLKVDVSGDHRRDDDIASAAVRAISWQAADPDCAIRVDVEDGSIVLTGHVARQSQREDAEGDLRRLQGVVDLDNQLTIKPQVSASDVADAITHAMNRSWMFDPNHIAVNATEGNVRLSGTVHTLHDKYIAGATAWSAPGVTEVQNDIGVV